MAWIELHDNLKEHRKVYALCEELNINKATVIGLLGCLWMWCNVYAQDGVLTGIPQKAIASACEWTKKPDQLISALIKCGWLDDDGKGQLAVHDWYDYAGRLIEKRAANADRMRSARASNNNTERATHVQRTERAQCSARAGATVPNHTIPNQTIPNHTVVDVDKRAREEDYGGGDIGLAPEEDHPDEETVTLRSVMETTQRCGWKLPCYKDGEEATELIAAYGATWVIAAIERAHSRGITSWAYTRSILEKWRTKGGIDDPIPPRADQARASPGQTTLARGDGFLEIAARLEREDKQRDNLGYGASP